MTEYCERNYAIEKSGSRHVNRNMETVVIPEYVKNKFIKIFTNIGFDEVIQNSCSSKMLAFSFLLNI